MSKLIWMTDLHYQATGDIGGIDPRIRLTEAVSLINTHYSDSDICVISGDMVNIETPTVYQALKAHLDQLAIPYLPMVGNHDDRAMMKSYLTAPQNCMDDFVQYSVDLEDYLILCLDTQKPGSAAGVFCDARMDWLRDTLIDAGDKPVLIFMHHPPMALDLPEQDTIPLENGDEFLNLVTGFPIVQHLFIGHVHRAVSGIVRGIPYATMRAVSFQAPPPKPDWTWKGFTPVDEAPNLGLIHLHNTQINIQYIQICEGAVGSV